MELGDSRTKLRTQNQITPIISELPVILLEKRVKHEKNHFKGKKKGVK